MFGLLLVHFCKFDLLHVSAAAALSAETGKAAKSKDMKHLAQLLLC